MTLFGIPYDRRQLLYLSGDVLLAVIAIYLAHLFRFGLGPGELLDLLRYSTGASFVFVGTNLILLYVLDGFGTGVDFRRLFPVVRLWIGVGLALVVQMVLYYAVPNWGWGRGVAALATLSFAGGLTAWRVILSVLQPVPAVRLQTLVVGGGEFGKAICDVIKAHPEQSRIYDLVGVLEDDAQAVPSGLTHVGSPDRLMELVAKYRVGSIIVAIPSGMSPELTRDLLDCKGRGLRIEDSRSVYKRITGKVPVFHISNTALIFGPDFAGSSRVMSAMQRLADIGISLVGLTVSAPIVALAGLAIKLETPGPMFFLQERVGVNEKPFTIVKLRTMGVDAEAKSGAVWSQGAGDPRVTRVGKFLRRSRIDELPQFWNVLRGDMSMVGPRPERDHFVRQLKERIPFYGLRFVVKPGVTGWAQVMYRYGASEEDAAEKLRYDLFAVQELSPMLYTLILLKTVQTVLLRPGS